MDEIDAQTALLVIDLQKAIDDPVWGIRNNPGAESNVQRLLSAWRDRRMPVYHIRHDSTEPQSTYRPGQSGNEFKPETAPAGGEEVIAKRVQNAMIGTDLPRILVERGQRVLAVTGVITNNSVEATVRGAANLGFEVLLVEDGCFTFGRRDWHGQWRTADEVHAMSLANLSGEYCRVMNTDEILAALPQP